MTEEQMAAIECVSKVAHTDWWSDCVGDQDEYSFEQTVQAWELIDALVAWERAKLTPARGTE